MYGWRSTSGTMAWVRQQSEILVRFWGWEWKLILNQVLFIMRFCRFHAIMSESFHIPIWKLYYFNTGNCVQLYHLLNSLFDINIISIKTNNQSSLPSSPFSTKRAIIHLLLQVSDWRGLISCRIPNCPLFLPHCYVGQARLTINEYVIYV